MNFNANNQECINRVMEETTLVPRRESPMYIYLAENLLKVLSRGPWIGGRKVEAQTRGKHFVGKYGDGRDFHPLQIARPIANLLVPSILFRS